MKSILSVSAFLSTLISTSLYAQSSMELDSIVIRGTKEQKKYNETTSSISVIKNDDFKAGTIDNSINSLNGVSNVQINKNGESYSIRGINNTGVTGVQKDNLASTIIDDVFQSDLAIRAGVFDLWDLDGMEIHRGGQATTQGINSLAGTILVNHKEPSFFREGKLRLGYGSFDRKEAAVMTNNEIIPGVLTSRITYNKDASDGYIKNVITNNDKWGRKNKDAARASFLYQISDSDKLVFDLKMFRNSTGGTYVQGSDPFKHEVFEDIDYKNKAHNTQGAVRYYKKFNEDFSNTLIVAFSKSKQEVSSDADGTKNNLAGLRTEDYKDQMMTLENLLQYKSGKINNTLGFNLHNYKLNDYHHFNVMFPIGGSNYALIDAIQAQKNLKTVYSLFDSFTYDFTQEHSLNLGLRLEYVVNEYQTFLYGVRNGNYGGANTTIDNYVAGIIGDHGDENKKLMALPKLGYVYHLNANNDFGLSYSQAYRNGGVSVNRRRGTASSYDPELTHNYELSQKYNDKTFNVSTNIFYTNWKKQQVQVRVVQNDPYDSSIKNASSSELYGAEVQGGVKILSRHHLGASVGYVATKFLNFKSGSTNYAGKEFPNAPKYTGLISWKSEVTDNLNVGVIGRLLGQSWANAENTKRAPNQYYIDLNAEYVFSSYGIEVYTKNLFDKDYLIYDGTPTSTAFPGTYHQVSTPRELGVRLTYNW